MDRTFIADLHNHTTASDGEYSPTELVNQAVALGLQAVGVTDHDTLNGLEEALAAGEAAGIRVVPGVEVSLEALTTRAAKLIKVELVEPERAIGKSTIEALQAGVVYGVAGEAEGVVRAIWAELGRKCPVIATGGMADLIARHSRVFEKVDQSLTLRGIEIVMRRQQRG
mgnify:CR=1 FL=1